MVAAYATLPPAASIAALAPLVAAMPESFTALAISPALITLADLRQRRHEARRPQREEIDVRHRQLREIRQAHLGDVVRA